jgi:hypothetical protein
VGAADPKAINTRHDALLWGDEWVAAYATLQAHADDLTATIGQLNDEVFMLQTRAVILEAEALLLRYDVAEALRKVPVEI